MKKDFSKEPQYWDWLARVEIAEGKGVNSVQLSRAVQVYEENLKSTPSPILAELYLKVLMEAVDRDGEAVIQFDTHASTVKLVTHIQEVFEKAESLGCINEDLASYLLYLSKLVEAKMLTEKLCSGRFPDAVNL
ncbi:U3 small nucleolar RNA-associated protein 6 [Salvia divinorum]|uniref:U3 small nucleolar RNA-associated protein 6 n=1 Tax=Salvia divinorum TaxID=28513 RepID=A0ABD1HYE7_SALDI